MSPSRPLFIGMDVHKETIAVAYVAQEHGAEAETPPRFGVTLDGVMRLLQDTRAETEAGTRRRQGRREPTHG
jgi:hypothetical protein